MPTETWELIEKLDKDLKQASRLFDQSTVRYFVDTYYQIQEFRKASKNQATIQAKTPEPNRVVGWVFENMKRLERDIQISLNEFTDQFTIGRWMKSITGIGPVISAGMLCHLDIRQAPTAGHYWSFAGIEPKARWGKGQKRPWNAKLKTLCFKMSDCFVKFSNHENEYYGTIYNARKAYEQEINNRNGYQALVTYILTGVCPMPYSDHTAGCGKDGIHCLVCRGHAKVDPKKFGKDTEAVKYYNDGKLPPGHIHMRCLRYTSKIFLSHLHHAMYEDYYGKAAPKPFVMQRFSNHTHYIPPPNWPFDDKADSLKVLYKE